MDPNERRARARFLTLLVGVTIAVNAAVVVLCQLSTQTSRQQYHAQAVNETTNLTYLLDETIKGQFEQINLTLLTLVDEVTRRGLPDSRGGAWTPWFLAEPTGHLPFVNTISVADAHGSLVYGVGAAKHLTAADRDYFIRLRDDPAAGLVISRPAIGRVNNKWSVFLARRFNTPGGEFGGVVIAVYEIEQFVALFKRVNIGNRGAIALREGDDLGLVVRFPETEDQANVVGQRTMSRAFNDAFRAGQDAGSYDAPSALDGRPRTWSYRKILGGRYLVFVGLAEEEYLEGWRRSSNRLWFFALIVFGVSLACDAALYAWWRRRNAAMMALLENAAFRRRVFESSRVPMVVADADTLRFIDCNPAATRIYGHASREETLTKRLPDVSAPIQSDGASMADKGMYYRQKALAEGIVVCEWRHRRPDGEEWDAEVQLMSFESEGRALLQFTIQELTERKKAEARIRQQAALLDITQDAVCVLRPDATVDYWNRTAEAMFGWTADEAMAVPAECTLGAGCEAQLRAGLAEVAARGTWTSELTTRTKQGRPIVVQARASVVREPDGRQTGCLLVCTDISETKQLEMQYLRAQRLECLGALASGIAHDLNNVLAPIVMSLDLLSDTLRASEDQATLELLQKSAQRGAGIVKQLLTFARGSESAHTEVNTRYLLGDLRRMIEQTFPRDIRFQLSFPPDLWNLLADATQIHQVLLNLCVNARDALTGDGRLSVVAENVTLDDSETAADPGARAGHFVLLRVADTGAGIDPEVLPRIFEPFFTTKAPGQGTGLGLATVQMIVRRHGGFIQVESVLGRGTEFRVYVPAIAGRASAEGADSAPGLAPGQGELVLVIDDEPAIREIARGILELHHYTVITAADGASGLQAFRERAAEIRLAVVDMMMPEMGGAQVVAGIRQIAARMPVIAMSGLSSQFEEASRAAGGSVVFLQKPFTGSELLRAVTSALADSPED